jgi:23S rRNA (uracil1939-C5)-methyltransferase
MASPNNRHTITVDKVVAGGLGLARLASGLVVMVPFVLPGETVAVQVGKEQKGYALASLLEVLDPSPERVEPACPHFQACGGCHFQHGTYQGQLAIKDSILRELFSRHPAKSAGADDFVCESILPSPKQFHYRQRIRLQVDDCGRLGFFARRSHAVVEVASCPLAGDELNQVLGDLRRLAPFRGLARQAVAVELLFSPLDERVVLIVHLGRKPRAADQQAAHAVAGGIELVQSVWLAGEGFAMRGPYGTTGGEGVTYGDVAMALPAGPGGRELALRFEAGGFCQVNLEQNERLVRQLLAWAEVGPKDAVLDLFCGMGNFSLPLALTARTVVGTDLQRSSIRGAQANAQGNGLHNCHFLRADASTAVHDLRKGKERFDLILLDPPRSGCREIIALLPELGAEKLIYISCDPATLVRDLRQLHGVGFGLRRFRGVDMFPQTCHLETIAMLVRE